MDYEVTDHGSMAGIEPLTAAARDWIDENVSTEPWQWFGPCLFIDHRYAGELLYGMQESGLTSNVTVVPA